MAPLFAWVASLLLLLAAVAASAGASKAVREHLPEEFLNVSQLVEFWGYPVELHEVTTADGYILSLQRIPHGKSETAGAAKGGAPRKTVFLQHGLLDSAATWVLDLPENSLGFLLADAGYDVWMGNSRGNRYSRKHVHLSPDSDAFWEFTWDDMARYDVPANVNYVRKVSGQATVAYVGHSEGTEIVFAALGGGGPQNRTTGDKLLHEHLWAVATLAPVTFLNHVTATVFHELSKFPDSIAFDVLGRKSFGTDQEELIKTLPWLCELAPELCYDSICLLAGCAPGDLNETRLSVLMAHYPAGTSVQNLVHYSQSIRSGKFQTYDFGSPAANEKHYGTPTNPDWALAKFPSASKNLLFWGTRDRMADPTDVKHLLSVLPAPPREVRSVPLGHGGFVWGLDATALVYKPLMEMLSKM